MLSRSPDAEALAAFKHNIRDEWLARHLGQEKPKSMAALTTLMTRFCAGKDSWLARSSNSASEPGTSEGRNSNGRPRRNKHKCHSNNDNTEDTAVNAGFSGSKSGQRKKLSKRTIRDHPAWTAYLIVHARFMEPQPNHPIIQIEIAGFLNKPTN